MRYENTSHFSCPMSHVYMSDSRKECVCVYTFNLIDSFVYTATHCNTLQHIYVSYSFFIPVCVLWWTLFRSDNNTLEHAATHWNTLEHTAPHCNTLQHTATHCNMSMYRKHFSFQCVFSCGLFSDLTTTHCNTLQHNATQCNTLKHVYAPFSFSISVCVLFCGLLSDLTFICIWG